MESLEQWKTISNCSNYEASSLGRIRNINNKTLVKGSLDKNGYPIVSIKFDNKPEGNKTNTMNKKLNMIIAKTFLTSSQNSKDKVNHKDGNILNCCFDNLEWYSQSGHVNSLYTQEETWKVLDGFDDPVYEISSKGRLINKKTNKIMNGSPNVNGYIAYSLYKNKKKKSYLAHRLVAENFLTKPDENQNIVNHKDGNKTNNCLENLEWATTQENIQHAYDNNLINVYTRKIKQYTLDDVFIREFSGAKEIVDTLNLKIKRGCITNACCGRLKTAHGFKWKYSEENPMYVELPGEEWKQFRGSDYWISNTGRVKNKHNKIMTLKGDERNSTGLTIDKKYTSFAVHRLVAECFIPNPDNLPQVDHIDKNPLNNHASNLRWISGLDNIRHSFAKKVDQLDLNGNLIKTWDCIMDVASELGIDRVGISKVCTGVQKTCGGFRWRHSLLNN